MRVMVGGASEGRKNEEGELRRDAHKEKRSTNWCAFENSFSKRGSMRSNAKQAEKEKNKERNGEKAHWRLDC